MQSKSNMFKKREGEMINQIVENMKKMLSSKKEHNLNKLYFFEKYYFTAHPVIHFWLRFNCLSVHASYRSLYFQKHIVPNENRINQQ